jgi:ABC-type glutathione transport system ATPase component
MEELFITKIDIKNVRHLKDISIPLSTETRKHLILTGKNGSGKTSVLNAIRDYLMFGIEVQGLVSFPGTMKGILDVTTQALEIQEELNKNPNAQYLQPSVTNLFQQVGGKVNEMSWLQPISLETVGNIDTVTSQFHLGQFLMVFFPAKRPNRG